MYIFHGYEYTNSRFLYECRHTHTLSLLCIVRSLDADIYIYIYIYYIDICIYK